MVAASIALSPVSSTAKDVVDRFQSITNREDTSTTERSATVSETLPTRRVAPRSVTVSAPPARPRG